MSDLGNGQEAEVMRLPTSDETGFVLTLIKVKVPVCQTLMA